MDIAPRKQGPRMKSTAVTLWGVIVRWLAVVVVPALVETWRSWIWKVRIPTTPCISWAVLALHYHANRSTTPMARIWARFSHLQKGWVMFGYVGVIRWRRWPFTATNSILTLPQPCWTLSVVGAFVSVVHKIGETYLGSWIGINMDQCSIMFLLL